MAIIDPMVTRTLPPPEHSFFLLGPRATGKTTWIHQNFPDAPTYDLLRSDELLRLASDPSVLGRECEELPDQAWIVIDEVQRAPALLDEVQRLMTRKHQRFVLSGSSTRKLRRGGANLLAGRAEVHRLLPFTMSELSFERDLEDALAYGMLPLAVEREKPHAFLKSYCETYIREEVMAEALVRQIGSFARFLEVAARMNAQVVNVSSTARDASVARPTATDYFQILVDTLLADWVEAWRPKPGVRQTVHPKLYFFDTGVVCQLSARAPGPVRPEDRGFLLETFVLHELRAHIEYADLGYPVRYWRTHDGAEVDFVVETDRGPVLIEVKSGARWEAKFGAGIARFRAEYSGVRDAVGVYCGTRALRQDGLRVLPWKTFLKELAEGSIL